MPVHLRLNDQDTTRNPYINFVTALPGSRHDEALRRLQQLSAMVKPLMKEQGFHINSLEEYEWNREFAGRCWNNGEVIELVLTSSKGTWLPLQHVLYVFCHELAHIKHMNHIPRLHGALTRHLKESALEKQRQGYYGDGMWSAGQKLSSGSWKAGLGMSQASADLPEHVCGGAFRRARIGPGSSSRRRTRRSGMKPGRKFAGPSLHTGAQTAPNTRGGNRRVQLGVSTSDQGSRVDGRNWIPTASAKDSSYKMDENSTFRKRTQTKDARELRANAALSRFAQTNQSEAIDVKPPLADSKANSLLLERPMAERRAKSEPEVEEDRTASLPTSGENLKREPDQEHSHEGDSNGPGTDESETESEDDGLPPSTQGWHETSEERRRHLLTFQNENADDNGDDGNEWSTLLACSSEPAEADNGSGSTKPRPVKRVKEESDDDCITIVGVKRQATKPTAAPSGSQHAEHVQPASSTREWVCAVCTLINAPVLKRCAACETTRGRTALGS